MKKRSLLSVILAFAICTAMLLSAPLSGAASAAETPPLSGTIELSWPAEYGVINENWNPPAAGRVTLTVEYSELEDIYFEVDGRMAWPNSDGKLSCTVEVEPGYEVLIAAGCDSMEPKANKMVISYQYQSSGEGGNETDPTPEYTEVELDKRLSLDKDIYFKYDAAEDGTLKVEYTGIVINGPGKVEMKVDGNDASLVTMDCINGEPSSLSLKLKSGESAIIVATAGYLDAFVRFTPEDSEGGGEVEPAVGTEENPEVLTAIDKVDVALENGEYFYNWTADKTGKLTLKTTGDGSQNLVVWLNGNKDMQYSNWDAENNGEHITLDVKEGDVLTLKAFFKDAGAGTMNVEGTIEEESEDVEPAVGTEENPEVLTAIDKVDVVLENGEYFYNWTADKTGKLTLKTTGDGSQNLVVWLNGNKDMQYSNWDAENNGEHITLDVKEGDVLTLKAFFKDAGAGTMNVEGTIEEESEEINPPTGDGIYAIALMGMAAVTGLAVVASKKKAF